MSKAGNVEEAELRLGIVEVMRELAARGLNHGTTGNVSARCGAGLLVTPSGIPPDRLTAETIVYLDGDGTPRPGEATPSSEWRMHARILSRRKDVNAIIHCHSRYATTLACAGKAIPAMHYMVGVVGRPDVPLASYATFGTAELADHVADALPFGFACLMANHGLIVVAPSLSWALMITEETEEQAALYWGTLAIGGPTLLSDEQMKDNFRQFANYGQKR